MKLKKVLKYVDTWQKIRIWYADNPNQKAFQMWEGDGIDIPKKLLKYELIKRDNNEGAESIYALGDGYIRITIVKKQ